MLSVQKVSSRDVSDEKGIREDFFLSSFLSSKHSQLFTTDSFSLTACNFHWFKRFELLSLKQNIFQLPRLLQYASATNATSNFIQRQHFFSLLIFLFYSKSVIAKLLKTIIRNNCCYFTAKMKTVEVSRNKSYKYRNGTISVWPPIPVPPRRCKNIFVII